ncbi:Hsp20/alpha crystallin family protein [Sulfurimonas sp.]|uniref:Hsp20/alpha crystallin family protein n=1 Tax=Sulfurimonas sp. TaxID=2022749 RepID=UPI00356AA198
MKDNYLKIVLLVLLALLAVQGYFLYDMSRTLNDKQASSERADLFVLSNKDLLFDSIDKKESMFLEMEKFRHEMESNFLNFENFFNSIPSLNEFSQKLYRMPNFDMKEQDNQYIITMELPGLEKENIHLKTEGGKLFISAKSLKEDDNNTTTYYRHERRLSSYKRIIRLPSDADEKSMRSEYKNGLLSITFDKKNHKNVTSL